jgi:hypothetical protein
MCVFFPNFSTVDKKYWSVRVTLVATFINDFEISMKF